MHKIKIKLLTGITLLFLELLLLTAVSAQPNSLTQDPIFQFTATAKDYQTVLLMWHITPGNYLYRDRFKIRAIHPQKMRLANPILPPNYIKKNFPPLGFFSVYDKDMYIIQPLLHSNRQRITLQVSYQGCSESGYCYAPVTQTVSVNLSGDYMLPVKGQNNDASTPVTPQPVATTPTIKNPQDQISALLSTKSRWGIIVSFFVFGVLISFTPCVLPMVPILSGIILGQGKISHLRSFLLSLLYVLGMALTYAVAGVIFSLIGSSIQTDFQQPWLITIFVLIFIAMALSLFGLYDLQLPQNWRSKLSQISIHQKSGTWLGVTAMGIFSTLVLSPCVTPPLVGVLAYISQSGDAFIGGLALFTMGIGMGLPLLVIGAFGPKLLPHTGKWMIAVKNFMGVLMLAVAIWMLSRIIPALATMLLWGLLFLGCGVALGALSTVQGHMKHVQKTIGLALFIYGLVVMMGAWMGNTNPWEPLPQSSSASEKLALNFIPVRNITDVLHQMSQPQNKNKPVILDFYADWCITCKEIEYATFSHARVKQALTGFLLLRADITKNDQAAQALKRHFNVIAPPTILFFNSQHHEVHAARVVGMINAAAFLKRLNMD